ncbi:hypothetical protein FOXG_21893 [Fusarium oxysporum f. sp. lycopersici 4287]|uniref:Uncharacterized protein n=1 Tax=Fusarium oxysporum f. sp. lycopersici (strain 4287 / CBS 123668 / FGSC 9935 / NRRL 34936) TaxID=426428 RepID=A0A0J9W2G0_FUSO4|nr:hypothetical protein FOXG_21893 [Fusarium oxysporum f. sp. lycopersici 4287]KNB17259.1 hypothetical protein FOXG_21893 [Fusarium oxysporum f. sp. lycopersici 4287]
MPFNVFTTTVIAFLAAPALANPIDTLPAGLESHLESRAADVTARVGIASKTWLVQTMLLAWQRERKAAVKKNCQGCSQKGLNLYDCFNTGDEWKSMKFKC